MAVEFIRERDTLGEFYTARVHSPLGSTIRIDPSQSLECSITHQTKGKKDGFGVKFASGKHCRVLQIGSIGEATKFLRDIKTELGSARWFFEQ